MKVVKFNKSKHFTALVECLVARNAYVPTLAEMPKVGHMAYIGERLVAAAFLRKVEGGYAQIDGLTSNPNCAPAERHQAIDLVVAALLTEAKKLNIINVMFISSDESTMARSEKYGFKKLPLAVLAADFTKRSI